MKARPRSRRGQRRGQSMVEFAFVLPVFLLMVMGIVDLGRGILYFNTLSSLAREGARGGILGSMSNSARLQQICQRVVDEAQLPALGTTSCSSASADTAWTDGALTLTIHLGTTGSPTDPEKVTVAYNFTPITPLIDRVANIANGGSFQVSASSAMFVEGVLATPTLGPTNTPMPTFTQGPTNTPTITPTFTPTRTPTMTPE
jgi:Flp pilus assembly protein TadG